MLAQRNAARGRRASSEVPMRRWIFFLVFLLVIALPSRAQIGKQPMVHAGTPEDKALREIDETTDAAKKLELLEKFLADYAQSDVALQAYDRLIVHYVSVKDYDRAFAYGEKALAADADNFTIGFRLLTAAEEKGDVARAFGYGERLAGMLERYRASSPPEGISAGDWQSRKDGTLESLTDRIAYIEYALYRMGVQVADPGAKAALLERYVNAFPNAQFTTMAQVIAADAYQQARNPAKMVEFAQKVLARQPENFWMMVVLADYFSVPDAGQLDKAAEFARKALELIGPAAKPGSLTDEHWAQQKGLQEGLAHSALGQVLVHKTRDAQAMDELKAAAPLLKPYAFYYGRNQYFLGFVLARMKRIPEARTVLTEAVTIDSPYRRLAQETLNRVGGAPAKAPRKRP
jgi:tetratricopeptide (TPR) repeat protein